MVRHMGYEAHAIGFNYGQKHAIELQQAQKIADALNVPFTIVDVREFGKLMAPASALLTPELSVGDQSPLMAQGIPASFVPNRNALFLTIAHGYAQIIGASTVWTGVCQTDYSGYPDCRHAFINALESALNRGYETNIQIMTPLMYLTKGETFKMADEAHVLDLVIDESHTCYNGVRGEISEVSGHPMNLHDWGHGCGECPACKLRAKGWEDFKNMTRIDA